VSEKQKAKGTAAKKKADGAEVPELELHCLERPEGAVRLKKRRGQGEGSGLGRTAGRGHKGQRSRSGYSQRPGFEGGQMPLIRRLPKRGFTNVFRTEYAEVNVERLEALGEKEVTPELLMDRKVVRKLKDGVKILGNGEIKTAITVKAHAFTRSAQEKIEAAGGKIELIAPAKTEG
jgi:large subunit ribosomal protein L15